MKIILTGATGFVGQPLVKRLLNDGHELTVLSRAMKKGLDPRVQFGIWSPREGTLPAQAVAGADAVIHLAGEPISQRWTEEVKRRIRESRVAGTRNLVAGLRALPDPPRIFLSASAIGYYGDRGDELLTEKSAPGEGWLCDVCQEWEGAAQDAESFGARVACLRFGIVLGKSGGALQKMLPPFQLGLGGKLGSGQQWMSWIHLKDLVSLLVFALNDPKLSGAVNGTAPNPVRNAQFTSTLGSVLGRPALVPVPAFAVKLVFGEMAQIVLTGQQVVPEAARKAGFKFQFPGLREALEDILK